LTGGWPSLLVEISFTSRVAITDSHSFYGFNLTMPRSGRVRPAARTARRTLTSASAGA
jgi:hypothetical protein